MQKNFLLPAMALALFCVTASMAQSNRARIEIDLNTADLRERNLAADGQAVYPERQNRSARLRTDAVEIPIPVRQPFTAFSFFYHVDGQHHDDLSFALYTSANGRRWSFAGELEKDPEFEPGPEGRHKCAMQNLDPEVRFVRIQARYTKKGRTRLKKFELNFFVPGEGKSYIPHSQAPERTDSCSCALPAFRDRTQWCTENNCNPVLPPAYTTVSHLIVHHSAGVNNSSNWNAVVTAIWNDHVFNNGWSDIGYNWLIDPNGVLYQGRPDNAIGAHFCGQNSNTMGVCLMGNYTNVPPTNNALQTLQGLLAWKCCQRDLDPLASALHAASGLQLMTVSGHRDGCATQCPGNSAYPLLPQIRLETDTLLQQCSLISGTQQMPDPPDLSVYPNPFSHSLQIRTAPDNPIQSVTLLDAAGRPALSFQNTRSNSLTLDLPPSLPQGIYYLHVVTKNGSRTVALARQW